MRHLKKIQNKKKVLPLQYLSEKQQTLLWYFQVGQLQSLLQTAHQGLNT